MICTTAFSTQPKFGGFTYDTLLFLLQFGTLPGSFRHESWREPARPGTIEDDAQPCPARTATAHYVWTNVGQLRQVERVRPTCKTAGTTRQLHRPLALSLLTNSRELLGVALVSLRLKLPCLSPYREKTFSLTIKFITHNETFHQRFAHTLPHLAVNAPQLLHYDVWQRNRRSSVIQPPQSQTFQAITCNHTHKVSVLITLKHYNYGEFKATIQRFEKTLVKTPQLDIW